MEGRGDHRRVSFDDMAELYDRARPPYPAELVDDLVAMNDLGATSRVLEIGCGTGQLTVPLAVRGIPVVAVEVGPHLAELARRRTAHFDRIEVVEADFERWPVPGPFDLVVAAASFEWLDPRRRVSRCAAACGPGGALAVVESHFGWGARDRFSEESEACFARFIPDGHAGLRTLADLDAHRPALEGSRFHEASGKRYIASREYGASRYCDLVRTFPDVRALEGPHREALLASLFELIQIRFGGRIFRHDVYELWILR